MVSKSYIEFKTYSIIGNRATFSENVRIYSFSRGATSFAFVTVVTAGSGRNKAEYFELRNVNKELIYITDSDGIKILLGDEFGPIKG